MQLEPNGASVKSAAVSSVFSRPLALRRSLEGLNGKENGNHYNGLLLHRDHRGYEGVILG